MDRFAPGPPRNSVAPPGFAGSTVSSPTTKKPFPKHLEALRDATKIHGRNTAYDSGAIVPLQAFETSIPASAAVRAAEARAAELGQPEVPARRFQRGQ